MTEQTPRFSEEDMKTLYRAKIHFESVLKTSTLKGAPASLTKEISQIYEKTFNKKLNKNYNCMVCAFSNYRIVGQAYFAQLEEDAKKAVEEEANKVEETKEEAKPTKKTKKSKE